MVDIYVKTFTRDYVGYMDLSDAKTVLAKEDSAFENFNEVHSYSALKMKLPRKFKQRCSAQQELAQFDQALYRE